MKVFGLTTFALVAFAMNSLLCRAALGERAIDAASFTSVRLLSGAVVLAMILSLAGKQNSTNVKGNWPSAFFLFAYAICFSFAYLGLTTGTGALILFGSVQMTMIGFALVRGESPLPIEWVGLLAAFGGLVYLVFPGLTAPPLTSSFLMAAAGIAWGFYTLRGKGSDDPLGETTGNFIRSVPMVILAALPFLSHIDLSARGAILAIISGAVTSGLGYAVWYAALKYHSSTRAAILQLSVPIIAAVGGVIFLSEAAELRLLIAAALVLGGIGLVVLTKTSPNSSESQR
jgi:Predicted permease, DMT superfamily